MRKNLTESVANIWDYTSGFHKYKWNLWKFRKLSLWFCNLEMISQLDSQLQKWNLNLRSGTRVLASGFVATKFLLNLVQLSSNGHNFFISALICTLFEALDSWLPELRKDIVYIKWTPGSTRNVSYSCCPLGFLHVRFLSLFFLLAFLTCFWKRTKKLQILYYSCKWASICFVMNYTKLSLNLRLLWWSKSYQQHQNLTQFD